MSDDLLARHGITAVKTRRGMRYGLPWRRFPGFFGGPLAMILGAALPCGLALMLPHGMLHVMVGPGRAWPIECWVWAIAWWTICTFFFLLFGTAGVVIALKGSRGFLWVTAAGIQSMQFKGSEGRTCYVRRGAIERFEVLPLDEEPGMGKLLAYTKNDAHRLADEYPVEVLEALKERLKDEG